jgi:DUF4097 and DUF4098 domain-containing protein YvlB
MKTYFKFLTIAALTAIVAMPTAAGASGKYSTVNSSIQLGDNTRTGDVDSVNGSIRIGANSTVKSVESVNGSIKLGNDVTVDGSIDAVNGSINLQAGCEVGASVTTVNGAVSLENTRVAGDVETVNGKLAILDRSEVSGNVVVRRPGGWNFSKRDKPVYVEIGKDVVVHGKLIFEQPVELKLHDSARVGEIIGDEVKMVGSS